MAHSRQYEVSWISHARAASPYRFRSSGKASKMAKLEGPSRMANHASVPRSASTTGSASALP